MHSFYVKTIIKLTSVEGNTKLWQIKIVPNTAQFEKKKRTNFSLAKFQKNILQVWAIWADRENFFSYEESFVLYFYGQKNKELDLL